jgi:hypothetical protein
MEPSRRQSICFRFIASYSQFIDKEACMARMRRFQGAATICCEPEMIARDAGKAPEAESATYGKQEPNQGSERPPPDSCRARV